MSEEYRDPDLMERFYAQQERKWANGTYVNRCEGCAAEDCACCSYNPNN